MATTVSTTALAREILAVASQTETECSAAANTASTVVMNVRMVAGMMGEMLHGIAEVKSRVAESQQCALDAKSRAQAAVERVVILTKVVDQIASTADLINRIASQTNMLALNATIEAARAGEAGRGFAVVASEVKNLSKQTAQATESVNQQLASVRQANDEVVVAVEAVSRNLETIQSLVTAVAASVNEQTASIDTIKDYAKEAADGVEGIGTTLDRIAEMAHLTSEKVCKSETMETV